MKVILKDKNQQRSSSRMISIALHVFDQFFFPSILSITSQSFISSLSFSMCAFFHFHFRQILFHFHFSISFRDEEGNEPHP